VLVVRAATVMSIAADPRVRECLPDRLVAEALERGPLTRRQASDILAGKVLAGTEHGAAGRALSRMVAFGLAEFDLTTDRYRVRSS
jgi:hypothetical protein